MRLLLDTNIFLEIVLEQERAPEAKSLLINADQHEFFASDFSLHSIGLALFRPRRYEMFRVFVKDMLLVAGTTLLSLNVADMGSVAVAAERFKLDFDDAYQYVVAGKHNLTIVSFDSDFDRTERGRLTPAQVG
jgi:hypothetical protein